MTRTSTRFGTGVITLAAILGVAGLSGTAQNTSGQDPAADRHAGPGGHGSPGGPGRAGAVELEEERGGPMGWGSRFGIPLGRLGLTDAQREQVRAVMQSHGAELKALADRAFAAHEALHAAIAADPVDEGTIRARSGDVAAVQADEAVTRARIRAEVFQVLTPEQRAKASDSAGRPGGRGGGPRSRP
jgi:Spy/CpxP family protein refolding chaperone